MAIPSLHDGYGPVAAEHRDGDLVATMHGVEVVVSEDRGAVRLAHRSGLAWSGTPDVRALDRSAAAQTLARPGLTAATIEEDGSSIRVALWVALDVDAHGLALAVRDVVATVGAVAAAAETVGASFVPLEPTDDAADAPTDDEPAEEPVVEGPVDDVSPDVEQPADTGSDGGVEPAGDAGVEPADDTDDVGAAALAGVAAAGVVAGTAAAEEPAAEEPAAEEPAAEEPAAEEPAAEEPAAEETVWGYVQEPVDVRGLTATDQVVGQLVPGQWYAILQTGNGWAHVVSADGALEGWADERAITRHG